MADDLMLWGLKVGDLATWAGAAGSLIAALAAVYAARMALQIANKGIKTERLLRDEEAKARETERHRRASLHAAMVSHELHNLVAHSIAWREMATDGRFSVGELYDHIAVFKTPALVQLMEHIDYFEVGAGAEFARLLNYFRATQGMAISNRDFMGDWSADKRARAKSYFLRDVSRLVTDATDGYRLAVHISGVTTYTTTPESDASTIIAAQIRLRDAEFQEADRRHEHI